MSLPLYVGHPLGSFTIHFNNQPWSSPLNQFNVVHKMFHVGDLFNSQKTMPPGMQEQVLYGQWIVGIQLVLCK